MSDTDTNESIFEKLEDAIERSIKKNGEKIEIEV
jgi:hypothetical protein